jgi:hypothetical protein
MYKVQSVIFQKSRWNPQSATAWLLSNGYKLKKIDETKKFYRFRQYTPSYLKQAGYYTVRTTALGNGVELVIFYGGSKIKGGAMSWSDYAKKAYDIATFNPTKSITNAVTNAVTATANVYWNGRDKLIPSSQKVVDEYGNQPVVGMRILKTPLKSTLMAVIDGVTFGQMSQVMDVNDYDKLFHLQLFVRVEDGTWISMEKETTVKVSLKNPDKIKADLDGDTLPVAVKPNMTINELLKNTEKYMGTDKFFHYSSKDNNCQSFVNGILEANGLADARTNKFVKQNTQDAFSEWSRKVTNTVTDLGHLAETAFQGGRVLRSRTRRRNPIDYLNYSALVGGMVPPRDYLNYSSF